MTTRLPWGPVIFFGLCVGVLTCWMSWEFGWPAWAYRWRPPLDVVDQALDDPIELYPAEDDAWRERLRRIHHEDELAADHWRQKKGIG